MGRFLAIDYGRRRCGLAVTDTLRIAANPLETVPTGRLETFLREYMAAEKVDAIVVGQPRTMSGADSESMRYIRPAVERLHRLFPGLEIILWDERFTSVLAHRSMLDGGMHRMARRDKATVDRTAAAIILNDYLQSKSYSDNR